MRLGISGGDIPPELVAILAALFLTFSLQFFESTAFLPALLRLTPDVWERGQLWRLFTYAFTGSGGPDIWFLLELLVVFWFGRDVARSLGRRDFHKFVLAVVLLSSLVATAFALLSARFPGAPGTSYPFALVQGQRALLAGLIAAFATTNGHATVLLFFVVPVEARWFILIELAMAFVGFLSTHDLAGFAGICAAVAAGRFYVLPGGIRGWWRARRLTWKRGKIERELKKLRDERDLKVVRNDDDDPGKKWVN